MVGNTFYKDSANYNNVVVMRPRGQCGPHPCHPIDELSVDHFLQMSQTISFQIHAMTIHAKLKFVPAAPAVEKS